MAPSGATPTTTRWPSRSSTPCEAANGVPVRRHHRRRPQLLRRRLAVDAERADDRRDARRSTAPRCACSTRSARAPDRSSPRSTAQPQAAATSSSSRATSPSPPARRRSARPAPGWAARRSRVPRTSCRCRSARSAPRSSASCAVATPPSRRWTSAWSTRSSTTTSSRRRCGAGATSCTALSPRYLEIAKVSSNIWWNSARDSFTTGLGMLVQAIGSDDMVEGANAFLEKRPRSSSFTSSPHRPSRFAPYSTS